jgi:hypothetical protein
MPINTIIMLFAVTLIKFEVPFVFPITLLYLVFDGVMSSFNYNIVF